MPSYCGMKQRVQQKIKLKLFLGSHQGPGTRFSGFCRIHLGSHCNPGFQFSGVSRVPVGIHQGPAFLLYNFSRTLLGSHQGSGSRFSDFVGSQVPVFQYVINYSYTGTESLKQFIELLRICTQLLNSICVNSAAIFTLVYQFIYWFVLNFFRNIFQPRHRFL